MSRTLVRTDAYQLDHGFSTWQQQFGTPTVYNESDLPTLTVELAPAPNDVGTLLLLFVPQPATLDANGTFLTVPDEVELAVLFGAMADLLSSDGESNDPQRAAFCESMYSIIVDLTNSLLGGAPEQ